MVRVHGPGHLITRDGKPEPTGAEEASIHEKTTVPGDLHPAARPVMAHGDRPCPHIPDFTRALRCPAVWALHCWRPWL